MQIAIAEAFDNEKGLCLGRKDRSRKGSIDYKMLRLFGLLNGSSRYYTTSSCSGRIMLLVPGTTKKDTAWLFVSHKPVSMRQLQRILCGRLPRKDVWFRAGRQ